MAANELRVVVAAAQEWTQLGIIASLERFPSVTVVGTASSGDEAVAAAIESTPSVLVLRPTPPQLDPVDVARCLQEASSATPLLVLTRRRNSAGDTRLAVESGAYAPASCVPTNAPPDVLRSALDLTAVGFVVRGAEAQSMDGAGPSLPFRKGSELAELPELTDREKAVLAHLMGGLTNKDIAAQLSVSVRTVEARLSNLAAKLGVHSRQQVILRVLKSSLVD